MEWLKMIFSNPILTTIVGGVVGFLIKLAFDYFKHRRLETLRFRMEFVQKQLSEFYWPLYSKLLFDEAVWKLRNVIDKMDISQQQLIREAIERDLLFPNHKAMVDIISTKLHLAGYLQVPEIYEQYLRHIAAFQVLRTANHQEPPSKLGFAWPAGFAEEVEKRTMELSKQFADLIEVTLYTKQPEFTQPQVPAQSPKS